MLAALVAVVSACVWYRNSHPQIDKAWQTQIFPDCNESLTLKRSDGQEFNVDLTGVKMADGSIVQYDIGLLSDNDPPLAAFYEDVHYVDEACEEL